MTIDDNITARAFPRASLWVLVAMFVGTSLAALIVWIRSTSTDDLMVVGQVPEFTFTESGGNSFGKEQMAGKVTIVDFFFTRCLMVCPEMNGNMATLYRTFAARKDVLFVSVSVDPDHDTLELLREYAFGWGVNDQRWVFLRAPVEEVVRLSERGFLLPADGLPAGHSAKLSLVDQKGRIRGYYSGLDKKEIILLERDIRRLLVKGP